MTKLIRHKCLKLNDDDNDAKNRHSWAYLPYVHTVYVDLFDDKIGGFSKLILSQNHFDQIVISILAGGKKGPKKIHYHEWFPLIASNKDTKAI